MLRTKIVGVVFAFTYGYTNINFMNGYHTYKDCIDACLNCGAI